MATAALQQQQQKKEEEVVVVEGAVAMAVAAQAITMPIEAATHGY